MRATKANWRSACLQVLYRIRRRACAISSVCGDKGGAGWDPALPGCKQRLARAYLQMHGCKAGFLSEKQHPEWCNPNKHLCKVAPSTLHPPPHRHRRPSALAS